jgi:predicted transcriptional regulator
MNIGENIKKIRTWKDISQKELSLSTRIPQATISKIEAGQDFLWSRLVKISHALSVEVQDIVCFDGSKVTFNLIGNRTKGMVINHSHNEHESELVKTLRDENAFLRRVVERAVTKPQKKKN